MLALGVAAAYLAGLRRSAPVPAKRASSPPSTPATTATATTAAAPTAPQEPGAATATTTGGKILLGGTPWFPLLEYGECSTLYGSSLATGITLFAANPCGGLQAQEDALAGRAHSLGVVNLPGGTGSGAIGTFYPDEADAHGYTGRTLPTLPPGLRFLTLTNHFYSGADPLPHGRTVYPGLIARADVVGFDLYPLQGWCQSTRLADVFAAQQELVALAQGKPTFQWIEAAGMNCPSTAVDLVTPATVRAEAWLAIAGGAHGLGFFPAAWAADVASAITRLAQEVVTLGPAVLSTPLPGVSVDGAARAAAWQANDALTVVAINPTADTLRATIHVPGLPAAPVTVLEESRNVTPTHSAIVDTFAPFQVHLYAAP